MCLPLLEYVGHSQGWWVFSVAIDAGERERTHLHSGLNTLQNRAPDKAGFLKGKRNTASFGWREQQKNGVASSDHFSPCQIVNVRSDWQVVHVLELFTPSPGQLAPLAACQGQRHEAGTLNMLATHSWGMACWGGLSGVKGFTDNISTLILKLTKFCTWMSPAPHVQSFPTPVVPVV